MADVHRMPDAGEVEVAASEWFARLHADDVTAEDLARFEAWRVAHPMHARSYAALCDTWEQFAAAQALVQAVSFAQSVSAPATAPARPTRRARATLAAAAAAAALLGAWLCLQRPLPDTAYSTVSGEHASIALPDGSTLELNSDSLARVDYSAHARVIHLDRGEGFFKVAHDSQRPFWVVGGQSWVRAVGTEFDVYVRAIDVRVTVSEGTVKVGASGSRVSGVPSDETQLKGAAWVLNAGDQADLSSVKTATRQLSPAKLAGSMAWRQGVLYFENQPLAEVVDELKRYTTLRIVLQSDALRSLPVGGTFQASPEGTQTLLQLLQQGLGLRVRRAQERVYIEPAEHSAVRAAVRAAAHSTQHSLSSEAP